MRFDRLAEKNSYAYCRYLTAEFLWEGERRALFPHKLSRAEALGEREREREGHGALLMTSCGGNWGRKRTEQYLVDSPRIASEGDQREA